MDKELSFSSEVQQIIFDIGQYRQTCMSWIADKLVHCLFLGLVLKYRYVLQEKVKEYIFANTWYDSSFTVLTARAEHMDIGIPTELNVLP